MPERSSPPTRPLRSLLAQLPHACLLAGDPATPIAALALDSRLVQPGTLFVAIPGLKQDGRAFIAEALARGAVAVVGEPPLPESPGVARVAVPSARQALADLAAAFFGHPSLELTLIGVTGTLWAYRHLCPGRAFGEALALLVPGHPVLAELHGRLAALDGPACP